jgi:hypothetical protein
LINQSGSAFHTNYSLWRDGPAETDPYYLLAKGIGPGLDGIEPQL